MQRDTAALAKATASVVRDYVSKVLGPLEQRLGELDEKLIALPVPKDGADGKSVTAQDVAPLLLAAIAEEVSKVQIPKDGTDGRNAYEVAVSLGFDGDVYAWQDSLIGLAGKDGESVTADQVLPVLQSDLAKAIEALPIPQNGKDGKDGSDGTDGKDGVNGTSVTVEQVLPELHSQLAKAVAEIPVPKDGRDGADGKSITIDNVRPMMEQALAVWELEFERRATDLIQRCIDRIEKPKDGSPGKDGRDAFDLENVELSIGEDERTLTLAFVRGEDRIERSIVLHHPIYRGVWRFEGAYQKGDCVTFGGSTFVAMADTVAKPETDESWKLSVKRGRDGKDGIKGDKGDPGPRGKGT